MDDAILQDGGYETDDFVYILLPAQAPLSNWSAHRIKVWGLQFATVEHAYQYRKFRDVDLAWAKRIKNAISPWEAKRMSRLRPIVPEVWDVQRADIMTELIGTKVRQHVDVRESLSHTGDRAIVNSNSTDPFWGIGERSTGLNMLGKIWIMIREIYCRP